MPEIYQRSYSPINIHMNSVISTSNTLPLRLYCANTILSIVMATYEYTIYTGSLNTALHHPCTILGSNNDRLLSSAHQNLYHIRGYYNRRTLNPSTLFKKKKRGAPHCTFLVQYVNAINSTLIQKYRERFRRGG